MMKTQTLHIVGSIRWLFIYNLPLYFLFLSFLLSGQVGNGVVYVSNNVTIAGSQHLHLSSEKSEIPNAIALSGNAELIGFSGNSKRKPAKIQKKLVSKTDAHNIQKELKKEIAKKLKVPQKVNVAKVNPAKPDTFFHSNHFNISTAVSSVSQWYAKKAMVNSYLEMTSPDQYRERVLIVFHRHLAMAESGKTFAFIRPPPSKFSDASAS